MSDERLRVAHFFDFDDVLFKRGALIRVIGLLNGKIKPSKEPIASLDEIPSIIRTVEDRPMGIFEYGSWMLHRIRRLRPGAKEGLEAEYSSGVHIYGNTGRKNNRKWVKMSREALTRAGVFQYFTDIFYTPYGVDGIASKIDALRGLSDKYDLIYHDEDDPRAGVEIARLLPGVTVNLFQYNTTKRLVPQAVVDSYANIRKVPVRRSWL